MRSRSSCACHPGEGRPGGGEVGLGGDHLVLEVGGAERRELLALRDDGADVDIARDQPPADFEADLADVARLDAAGALSHQFELVWRHDGHPRGRTAGGAAVSWSSLQPAKNRQATQAQRIGPDDRRMSFSARICRVAGDGVESGRACPTRFRFALIRQIDYAVNTRLTAHKRIPRRSLIWPAGYEPGAERRFGDRCPGGGRKAQGHLVIADALSAGTAELLADCFVSLSVACYRRGVVELEGRPDLCVAFGCQPRGLRVTPAPMCPRDDTGSATLFKINDLRPREGWTGDRFGQPTSRANPFSVRPTRQKFLVVFEGCSGRAVDCGRVGTAEIRSLIAVFSEPVDYRHLVNRFRPLISLAFLARPPGKFRSQPVGRRSNLGSKSLWLDRYAVGRSCQRRGPRIEVCGASILVG